VKSDEIKKGADCGRGQLILIKAITRFYRPMEKANLAKFFSTISGVAMARPKAWLRVTGEDAATFLQGQCTQDVHKMKDGEARWALWLTTKGRVLGESLVVRAADGVWWLWSAHTEGTALKARLEDFIIADEVVVDDLGAAAEGWEQITLAGEQAETWLRAALGGVAPPAEGAWTALRGGVLLAGRRGLVRVWDWLRPKAGSEASDWAAAGLGVLSDDELVRARLAAGVPAIPAEFGPADLPQEAGLETVAISFTKGCYLGQEVMARLHAMGQVRRRLLRAAGAGEAPAAGAGLLAEAAGKRVGEVRAAIDDGHGGWLGLAMVNLLGLDATKRPVLETDATRGVRLEDAL
jgi:folate-binding protein YgfZ